MLKDFSTHNQLINTLTPAELKFIYNNKESSGLKFAIITIEDLYVKRLVDIVPLKVEGNDDESEVEDVIYILKTSKKYNHEKLKSHEKLILDVIKNAEKDILINYFIKILFPFISDNRKYYYNELYLKLVDLGLCKRTFLLEKLDVFRLSSKGRQLAEFLQEFIPYCENNIDEWMESFPYLISELLEKFNTHILVSDSLYLKTINFFTALDKKSQTKYLDKIGNNPIAKYIRDYCSPEKFVVDFRDIDWQNTGSSSEFGTTETFSPLEAAMGA